MTSTARTVRRLWIVALASGAVACAPRLGALSGEAAPATLPRAELPTGHHLVTFEWEFSDPDMSGKGAGVARVASPDSVRLDFFLAGGFIGGGAVLIGDSLDIPGIELTRRLIPPPTMLWGALGRTRLPVTRDTAIRRDGEMKSRPGGASGDVKSSGMMTTPGPAWRTP